ncbi:MAG TPA: SCO family protein [Verrucomicrobiae bacterium]|nr:SCO family protein [Verrucomicrobiae bacterium]
MKTHFKLATPLFLLLTLLLCQQVSAADKTNPLQAPCCNKELKPSKPISDTSLYQLDSNWTTDQAKEIKLASLAGRPQVVTMFFANCVAACPILAHDMRKIEDALPEDIRTNVGFVLISFDTERDTPQALAKFRRARRIPESWTLLTAKPDDILELAALLGVKFRKDSVEQFSHSNLITILNEKGEVTFQQTGLNRDPSNAASALQKLVAPRTQ